jgi:hypothetical protein
LGNDELFGYCPKSTIVPTVASASVIKISCNPGDNPTVAFTSKEGGGTIVSTVDSIIDPAVNDKCDVSTSVGAQLNCYHGYFHVLITIDASELNTALTFTVS